MFSAERLATLLVGLVWERRLCLPEDERSYKLNRYSSLDIYSLALSILFLHHACEPEWVNDFFSSGQSLHHAAAGLHPEN
jgi:hypothetical protein